MIRKFSIIPACFNGRRTANNEQRIALLFFRLLLPQEKRFRTKDLIENEVLDEGQIPAIIDQGNETVYLLLDEGKWREMTEQEYEKEHNTRR